MAIHRVLILLLLFASAGIVRADDYLVGPGDVLGITVYDNDDLQTRVRVGDDGTVIMPLIGQVKVSDLTITGIRDKIAQLLSEGYLVNPQVNVFIEEFRSKKVVILGRIRTPGLIELRGPINLLELISKAGGLESDAGDTATIKRKEKGQDRLITINLDSLIEGGDITQNIPILDGDTVVIAKSAMCFVTGEVNKPGSYPCSEGSTVLQMIALAGGFTGKASKSSVRIVRVVNNEKKIFEDVDLDTTAVYNDDVIVVPESFF